MPQRELITRIQTHFATPAGKRLALWLAFFIFWAGAASYLPYIGVYYESVGLKGGQIGQLNSIPYFITLISSILFAFLSDKTRRHKLVLAVCILGVIAVLFIYPTARTFSAFVPIVLAYSILHAPCNAILDETTLAALGNSHEYGKIRVGGSIGWGIMVLVTGYLLDRLSIGLPLIFYLYIFFSVVFLVNIAFLPGAHPRSTNPEQQASLKKVMGLLRQPGFLPFLLVLIIWGLGEASIQNFLFLHIKHLGGSSTLMGTALATSLIAEIVVFSLADRIQARLNPFLLVLLAFVVLFAWLTGLSLIRNPHAIPFFQVFGGAGYALLQSGSVAYVDRRAPREIGTTAQAVRGGVYAGVGVGVGSILSGMIYEAAGSAALFRSMSLVALGGFLLGLLTYLFERHCQSRVRRQTHRDPS